MPSPSRSNVRGETWFTESQIIDPKLFTIGFVVAKLLMMFEPLREKPPIEDVDSKEVREEKELKALLIELLKMLVIFKPVPKILLTNPLKRLLVEVCSIRGCGLFVKNCLLFG
jgi:hypothetical protein